MKSLFFFLDLFLVIAFTFFFQHFYKKKKKYFFIKKKKKSKQNKTNEIKHFPCAKNREFRLEKWRNNCLKFPTNSFFSKSNLQHDAQYDFYGKKLATCSSYGYISIYDVSKTENIVELVSFQAYFFKKHIFHSKLI